MKLCILVSVLLTFTAMLALAAPGGYYEKLTAGKVVTVSSTYSTDYAAEYVNDNNVNTLWGTSTSGDYQWMYIDMGQTATFDVVEID